MSGDAPGLHMVAVTLVPRATAFFPQRSRFSERLYCDKSPPEWSRFDHSMRLRAIVDSSFGGRYQCRKPDKKEQLPEERREGVVAPLLQIKDLHTEFRTGAGVVCAVDGISYTVERGETVAIVGESGSGKSVGALSILRLIPDPPGRITRGEILFAGRDLMQLSDEKMREVRGGDIGMVFQEPMTSLNPVLTIGRQITETVEQHRRADSAAAHQRAIELLGLVGIADPARRLKQYPHQLSGGMRQRVMIAIAIACDPKLIIADEPTTALDVTIQAQILERVNVMYAGTIVESGPAAAIYHDPRHPYTMALLRSVPRLDRPRQARLDPVSGQPPDLTRLDQGCAFRPRCRFAVDACAQVRPPLEPAGPAGHLAACLRGEEIVAAAGAVA